MHTWKIEVTDTFGGDANYCWVKRFTVKANTMRGAINKFASENGAGWIFEYGDGDSARYNLRGASVCLFINWSETE